MLTFSRVFAPAGPVSITMADTTSLGTVAVVDDVGTADQTASPERSRQTSLAVPAGPNASLSRSVRTIGLSVTGGEGSRIA